MTKEKMYELIRNEETILFIGAGLSLYAGYPNAAQLSDFIYKNLPPNLKKHIEYTNDVSKLANDIFEIKGGDKSYLLKIAKLAFDKQPTSIETHQQLAKIPHFKTIITTNYDTLIELTNPNLDVVRKSTDYTKIVPNKQVLFKIHGDFTDTERIILTQADYIKYFSNSADQSVFWTAIRDKLASNNVIFVGYSIDDPNIQVIISKILNELGDCRKEMYFVSPSINAAKKAFLKRNSIHYIPITGEKLINEVFEDLKLNYFPNLPKGKGTADIALKFANQNSLKLNIGLKNENLNINSFETVEPARNELKVIVNLPKNLAETIKDTIDGNNFEDLVLDGSMIQSINHFVNGFRLFEYDDLKSFTFKKAPILSGKIDIVFEDGTEYNDFNLELFGIKPSDNLVQFKIKVDNYALQININLNHSNHHCIYNITFEPNDIITTANSGLIFCEIMHKVFSNTKFGIYQSNNLIYSYNLKLQEEALQIPLYEYLVNLRKIERHFNIRFINIKLDDCDENAVLYLLSYIDKQSVKRNFNNYNFKLIKSTDINEMLTLIERGSYIILVEEGKSFNLHGLEIKINFMNYIIRDPYINNLDAAKSGSESHLELRSKTNIIYHQLSELALIQNIL